MIPQRRIAQCRAAVALRGRKEDAAPYYSAVHAGRETEARGALNAGTWNIASGKGAGAKKVDNHH